MAGTTTCTICGVGSRTIGWNGPGEATSPSKSCGSRWPAPTSRNNAAARLLVGLLQADPELLDVPWPDTGRAAVDKVLAGMDRVPDAAEESLQALLASPPWMVKRAKAKYIVPTGIEAPGETVVSWLPGELMRAYEAEPDIVAGMLLFGPRTSCGRCSTRGIACRGRKASTWSTFSPGSAPTRRR